MAERGIMPWERGGGFVADMFGFLDEDPRIRAMREENHDRTQADVKAQARLENPRWIDTPASVFDELIAPIDRKYESDVEKERRLQREALAARSGFQALSPGSMLTDRATGEIIASNPTTPKVQRHKIPLGFDIWDKPSQFIDMTEEEFNSQYDTLPQISRDSAIGKLLRSRRPGTTPQSEPSRQPFGFIGREGGTNAFNNPFQRGFEKVAGTNAPSSGIKIRSIRVK